MEEISSGMNTERKEMLGQIAKAPPARNRREADSENRQWKPRGKKKKSCSQSTSDTGQAPASKNTHSVRKSSELPKNSPREQHLDAELGIRQVQNL